MHRRLPAAILLLAAVTAIAISSRAQPPAAKPGSDKAAIEQSARDFESAFNRGDAKAIAAMWTANGESRGEQILIGRDAIEKGYSEFFKANPDAKIEVLFDVVRFPADNLAVEEGLLRLTHGPKSLPSTTQYTALHIRDNGVWKIAISTESGAGIERVEDLDWLGGDWVSSANDSDVKFSFKKDPTKPVILASYRHTRKGEDPISGTMRIAGDPETDLLRSWSFQDDGGHSQAIWTHDGKSWLIETHGVLANGTPTSEVIVLQRVGPDVITWRSIDRVLGDTPMENTVPLRLTRTK